MADEWPARAGVIALASEGTIIVEIILQVIGFTERWVSLSALLVSQVYKVSTNDLFRISASSRSVPIFCQRSTWWRKNYELQPELTQTTAIHIMEKGPLDTETL